MLNRSKDRDENYNDRYVLLSSCISKDGGISFKRQEFKLVSNKRGT